ncbi:MAG: hypothetical protein ACI9OJ_001248, partial [Myxococcota bacterium]
KPEADLDDEPDLEDEVAEKRSPKTAPVPVPDEAESEAEVGAPDRPVVAPADPEVAVASVTRSERAPEFEEGSSTRRGPEPTPVAGGAAVAPGASPPTGNVVPEKSKSVKSAPKKRTAKRTAGKKKPAAKKKTAPKKKKPATKPKQKGGGFDVF